MRKLLLVLALAGPAFSAEPADGVYVKSEAAESVKVKGADGRDYGLGEKAGLEIKEAQVVAQTNANDAFWVSLKVPYARALEGVWHVLVVGGKAWAQSGGGSEAEAASYLSFMVSGRADADAVAARFGVKPFLRSHPGHKLEVSFVPGAREFAADAAKTVTLRIRNAGDRSVFFQAGGRNRAERDNQFVFRASDGLKALPDIGSDAHFGGLSVIKELKPGEVFELAADLGKWFALDKAGTYTVLGSWLLTFFESRTYTHPIWEDWATAEFQVRVAEPARAR